MGIFGNNYWGLKMGHVLMGLLSGILLLLICNKLLNKDSFSIILVASLFLFDFNILMLSREAITVIPCMLATSIYLTGLIFIKTESTQMFFNGLWPVIAFCLFYGGLPFIALFSFVYMLYSLKKNKAIIINYVLGVFVGVIICEIVDFVIFHQHVWSIVIETLFSHGDKISAPSIRGYIISIVEYLISNTFRYSFFTLLMSLWSVIVLLFAIYKTRQESIIMVLGLLFAHILQITFLPNLTQSKAAITYPLLLLIIVLAINYYNDEYKNDKLFRRFALIGIGFFSVVAFIIQIIGLLWKNNRSLADFDLIIVVIVSLISLALIWIGVFKNLKMSILHMSVLSMLLMLFLSYRYVYSDVTYLDKQMLQDLNRTVKTDPVINGTGFRLYNNIKSPINWYDHYHGIGYDENYVNGVIDSLSINTYGNLYFIDHHLDCNVDSINNRLSNYNVRYVLEKVYQRRYVRLGEEQSDINKSNRIKDINKNIRLYRLVRVEE